MKAFIAMAVLVAGAPALVEPASGGQHSGSEPAPRICVLVEHLRGGSRRICLTASQWQERLGPDWRQQLSGRYVEDDLALLATLARLRSEPDIRECKVCRETSPPGQD